jgi:probable rRNA maturation factor
LKPTPEVAIDVVVLDRRWLEAMPRAAPLVRRAVRMALAVARPGLPRAGATVAIALADDATVRALNRQHRGKDRPTNVLSYPSGEPVRRGAPRALGDVVLARGTVLREARAQHKSVPHHFVHLVVHGTLHLLGYDHEHEADAARMEALEVRILADLGVADPYAG